MPKPGSPPVIRWRKGEIIGAGAYGRVYMGMNVDSGELLAIKQVLISVNNVTKDKAQAHIRELEEEVRLLRNLSHPNIVRYLGTAREDEALNILLEFVPGGSIASLLGKFGSFTEPVIRMYTKQLLLGLEYLHSNNILHRDIKGANILVDNKGCIKLADFGASKKVVELATISEAKSMKGTPYWMAPEVIRQTGHNWQADIWSVGCTVIEMATGKPPWSQQFQEKTCCMYWLPWSLFLCKLPRFILHSFRSKVAALFHIGTTKSHPPIPEHLSPQAKDFLLQCLQREPKLRPSAAELLKHPFVTERIPDGPDSNRTVQQASADRNLVQGSDMPSTVGKSNCNTLRNGSLNAGQFSWARRGPLTMNGSPSLRPSGELKSRDNGRKADTSFREDANCSVRLDSLRNDSLGCSLGLDPVGHDNQNCSVRLNSVRNDYENCSVRLDSPNCSVRLDSVRNDYPRPSLRFDSLRNDNAGCSVRLDSVRSDYLTGVGMTSLRERFNPVSEPSWDGARRGPDLTFRADDNGNTPGAAEAERGVDSLQDDDDVTESKIRAFLDEKAQELKRLQTPLYEELYNIWNTPSENGPSESFIAPLSPSPAKHQAALSSRSPSKANSVSGRSGGMRSSRDSEMSINSGSPGGAGFPSAICSPLLEIPSPRLNEWKGLLHDAQAQHMLPPPSPGLNSERQKLWKEELQHELEMKREEKRKLTRTASTLTNTTQSPNKDKSLQRYGSRLAGSTPPTPK
ncbi:unnamed protein product [Calypogeia fissa]